MAEQTVRVRSTRATVYTRHPHRVYEVPATARVLRLIETGILIDADQPPPAPAPDPIPAPPLDPVVGLGIPPEATRAELVAEAEGLEIHVPKSWTRTQIRAAIEEAVQLAEGEFPPPVLVRDDDGPADDAQPVDNPGDDGGEG
jgi:hypothetical protein